MKTIKKLALPVIGLGVSSFILVLFDKSLIAIPFVLIQYFIIYIMVNQDKYICSECDGFMWKNKCSNNCEEYY